MCVCVHLLHLCIGCRRTLTSEAVEIIDSTEFVALQIHGAGPKLAIDRLKAEISSSNVSPGVWAKRARVAAVLGSCPRSISSLKSGVRHWIDFVTVLKGSDEQAFPATIDGVLAWSNLFRCLGTFKNYLGHVRTVSHALNVPAPEEGHPALRRAKGAILKRHFFESRPRMFIQRPMVGALVDLAERGQACTGDVMLWLFAYTFMLRVPSEALPAMRGGEGLEHAVDEQAVIWLEGATLVLRLHRRKNKPHGSMLRRSCTCACHPRICPVHVLWHGFLRPLPFGSKPWAEHTSSSANAALRVALSKLAVPRADLYRCHDLRRGHARDLFDSGTPLEDILRHGEWRGKSVRKYLDECDLEQQVVLEAAMESEDEQWIQ